MLGIKPGYLFHLLYTPPPLLWIVKEQLTVPANERDVVARIVPEVRRAREMDEDLYSCFLGVADG